MTDTCFILQMLPPFMMRWCAWLFVTAAVDNDPSTVPNSPSAWSDGSCSESSGITVQNWTVVGIIEQHKNLKSLVLWGSLIFSQNFDRSRDCGVGKRIVYPYEDFPWWIRDAGSIFAPDSVEGKGKLSLDTCCYRSTCIFLQGQHHNTLIALRNAGSCCLLCSMHTCVCWISFFNLTAI